MYNNKRTCQGKLPLPYYDSAKNERIIDTELSKLESKFCGVVRVFIEGMSSKETECHCSEGLAVTVLGMGYCG